jgi:predicted nucleic acid-binding protein
MSTPAPIDVVLDTSVLVNFLAIDRIDLLAGLLSYRFHITAHVRGEVTYPDQAARLATAIQNGHLQELPAGTHAELATFALLTATLGIGESAAIAAAQHRLMAVGVEDRTARRTAESLVGKRNVRNTTALMVSIIQAGLLTVAEADGIKLDWATNHRFALSQFRSFGDILSCPPSNPE